MHEFEGLVSADAIYLVASRKCLTNGQDDENMTRELERTYVIKSFLSFAFFSPPKAIFVPGMYFLGFSRYSNCAGI